MKLIEITITKDDKAEKLFVSPSHIIYVTEDVVNLSGTRATIVRLTDGQEHAASESVPMIRQRFEEASAK